jgi:hypothetical protein
LRRRPRRIHNQDLGRKIRQVGRSHGSARRSGQFHDDLASFIQSTAAAK